MPRQKGKAPPALTSAMPLSQISKLPVTSLRLCLDQFHLPHGGNKTAVAKRLYDHLQSQSGQDSSDGEEEESQDESETSGSGTPSDADGEEDTGASDNPVPFTMAQQHALEKVVKSLMQDRKRPRSRTSNHSSSDCRQKRRHRSPSPSRSSSPSSASSSTSRSSSTSSESSATSSDSSSSHRSGHRSRHRQKHSKRHHRHRSRRPRKHHAKDQSPWPLPRKLRHAIKRGEFIDLGNLLAEHLTSSGSSAQRGRGKRSAHARPITGIDTWLEAWSLFAGVLSSFKPKLAPALFKYQSFITRSSQRFQTYAWLQYDSQFRLKIASNPGMSWATADTELVASWLTADATRQKLACFSCGSPDHLSNDCPLKPAVRAPGICCPVCNTLGHTARDCPLMAPRSTAKPAKAEDDKYCHLYNKRGTCFRGPKCPYLHTCSGCNGGHPRRACPQQVQPVHQAR
jgi:hypothetical protein